MGTIWFLYLGKKKLRHKDQNFFANLPKINKKSDKHHNNASTKTSHHSSKFSTFIYLFFYRYLKRKDFSASLTFVQRESGWKSVLSGRRENFSQNSFFEQLHLWIRIIVKLLSDFLKSFKASGIENSPHLWQEMEKTFLLIPILKSFCPGSP